MRRVVDRSADGRALFGDVVGDLVNLTDDTALIDGRSGVVEVQLAHIAAAKLAWPSTADELALEAVAARGWRPSRLARSAGGCCVRPAGSPAAPTRCCRCALRACLSTTPWRPHGTGIARGLPLRIQVPLDARRLLDAGLGERGWPADPDVHVLAARLDALAQMPSGDAPSVDIVADPGPEWFGRYRNGVGATEAARALLTRHDRVGFASITLDGEVVAIGRGALDDEWLGVTAVEVAPALRRQGLASVVVQALWNWGSAAGAQRSYVQVSSDNPAAAALYERLGYWHHHNYRYRQDPSG